MVVSALQPLLSSDKVPLESLSAETIGDAVSAGPSAASPVSLSVSSPSRSQMTVMGLLRILLRALYLLLAAEGGVRDRPYFSPLMEKDGEVGEDREKTS